MNRCTGHSNFAPSFKPPQQSSVPPSPPLQNRKQLGYLLAFFFATSLPLRAQEDRRSAIAAHYRRAEQALAQGQTEVAEEEFTSILRVDPASFQAFANLGVIAYKANDYAKAQALFEKALSHNPALWMRRHFSASVRSGREGPRLVWLFWKMPSRTSTMRR